MPKPTAEQLNAYFEANKTKFQIPEFRAFSYVLLSVDDILPQVSVTAEQVKQEYEARSAEFGTPEKRDVDQAMADTEDKAKAIIAAATAGKSLEDATKEVLGNADGVIKLGLVTKKDLPPGPLADGIFGLPIGVAPAPIKSPLGWHVIRVNKIEPGKAVSFDEVKDKLEKDLKAQAAPDMLIKLVTDFERILSKSQSMKAAAEELGLKIKTYENVDARGQDAVGQAGRDRPGRRRAGAGRVRHPRKRRERPSGDAARRIFRRPHRPRHAGPHSRPQRSRSQGHRGLAGRGAAQARRRQGQGRRRQGRGRHRSRRARQGARPGGADHQGGHALRGRSAATTSPSRWCWRCSSCAPGKVQSVRTADGSVIVRLKQVEPVDLAKEKDALDRFGKQLDTMVANDLVLQLVAALRTKYGVTVDEAVFAAAFRPQQQP